MIAKYSSEIKIAIFQSVSEQRSIVKLRPSRGKNCAFYQRKLRDYWTVGSSPNLYTM